MELNTFLETLAKQLRVSDYDAARETIKKLVAIGLNDKELADKIIAA